MVLDQEAAENPPPSNGGTWVGGVLLGPAAESSGVGHFSGNPRGFRDLAGARGLGWSAATALWGGDGLEGLRGRGSGAGSPEVAEHPTGKIL